MWWESQDLPWVHRRRRTARWVCANSACRSLERSANRYGLHDTAGLRSNTYHPYARYLRAGKPLCPPPSMCARSEPRATPPSGEPPPTSQTADSWVGEGFGSVLVSIGVRDPSTWSATRARGPQGRRSARVGNPAAGKQRGSPNGSCRMLSSLEKWGEIGWRGSGHTPARDAPWVLLKRLPRTGVAAVSSRIKLACVSFRRAPTFGRGAPA